MIEPPFQWQIVRAQLDPTRGSEQAGTRPVLIVSREQSNAVLPVVTVLPLTTWRPGRRVYPTEILLSPEVAGQPNSSLVMAHQIRTLAKERLLDAYGRLEDEGLRAQIKQILKIHLDLQDSG